MRTLLAIFFNPPMAIARVGASPTPLDAFEWQTSRAEHGGVQTVIEPAISLRVDEDGCAQPLLPHSIRFKDDDGAVRPVAPFFELWARLQSPHDGSVEEQPLTPTLLHELGITLRHLAIEVTAGNFKAARRLADAKTGIADMGCSFTARVEIPGDDHARHPLLAFSRHTSGQQALVSPEQPIPLGAVQWLRPRAGRDPAFADVALDTLRLRFTPAVGTVYGPPRAVVGIDRLAVTGPIDVLQLAGTEQGRMHTIVPPNNRFLNDNTPYSRYRMVTGEYEDPQPQDGYDGADDGDSTAWGVVDDSCDAVITAGLAWRGQRYRCDARVFVGPPDFAPDRRPFYGVDADLDDRDLPPVQVTRDNFEAVKDEVVELFRRVFETASTLNLDQARTEGLQDNAMSTSATAQLPATGPSSMTRTDQPWVDRVPELTPGQQASVFSTTSARGDRLPFTQTVPFVHSQLMDETILMDFLRRRHAHVRRLLRPAFGTVPEWDENPGPEPHPDFRDPRVQRDLQHDMRMPPYMRDAYWVPLSLTRRQYQMMIGFLDLLAEEERLQAEAEKGHA
ncbi:hypothetical protein [Ideonella sp. BN130291]|uniref:hypothetical protein n=1 Tax=Ideonella sp. BN130291 TaxID=3112940 RepID=UPI002E26332F|nr:hypothetical protein [Ideonella sp. BN130291]